MAGNKRVNGQVTMANPRKPYSKPIQDPLVKEVRHIMEQDPYFTISQCAARTGMAKATIAGIYHAKTKQPHPSTLRMILRLYNKEIVIRDIGSNI